MEFEIRDEARFWYVASPFTRYFRGEAQACHDVVQHAALLAEMGVNVFTPIGHSYQLDQATTRSIGWERWMEMDFAVLRGACGLIRLQLPGWAASKGMHMEETYAQKLGLPVVVMEPWPQRDSLPLQELVDALIKVQVAERGVTPAVSGIEQPTQSELPLPLSSPKQTRSRKGH